MALVEVEVAIIGAGQAGVPLARALAGAGRRVALVERNQPGGSCVNWGCTPSKAMIASSRLAAQARRASEWGIRIPQVEVDFLAVMDRARGMVEGARGELEKSLAAEANLRLVRAHARLDGREGGRFRLRAGGDTLLAERVVLDTGTRSARPVEGLDDLPPERLIDSENWIERRGLPERVLFLGGGTIALEMAQAWRRFGAAVTMVESGSRLAEREDQEVSTELRAALEAEGVAVRCGVKATRVEPTAGGLRLRVEDGEALEATHLFVATGRQANPAAKPTRTTSGSAPSASNPANAAGSRWTTASARRSPASSPPATSAAAASSPTPPTTTPACWRANSSATAPAPPSACCPTRSSPNRSSAAWA